MSITTFHAQELAKLPGSYSLVYVAPAPGHDYDEWSITTSGNVITISAGNDEAAEQGAWRALYELGYRAYTPNIYHIPANNVGLGWAPITTRKDVLPYNKVFFNYGVAPSQQAANEKWTLINTCGDERRSYGHRWGSLKKAMVTYFAANPSHWVGTDNSGSFNVALTGAERAQCVSAVVDELIAQGFSNRNHTHYDPNDGDTNPTDDVMQWCEDTLIELRSRTGFGTHTLGIYVYANHRTPPTGSYPTCKAGLEGQVAIGFNSVGLGYDELTRQWAPFLKAIGTRRYGDIYAQRGMMFQTKTARSTQFSDEGLVDMPGLIASGLGVDAQTLETSGNWTLSIVGHYWNILFAHGVAVGGKEEYYQILDEMIVNIFGGDQKVREWFEAIDAPNWKTNKANIARLVMIIDGLTTCPEDRKLEFQQYMHMCWNHWNLRNDTRGDWNTSWEATVAVSQTNITSYSDSWVIVDQTGDRRELVENKGAGATELRFVAPKLNQMPIVAGNTFTYCDNNNGTITVTSNYATATADEVDKSGLSRERVNYEMATYWTKLEQNLLWSQGCETDNGGWFGNGYKRQLANALTDRYGRADLTFNTGAFWETFPRAPTAADFAVTVAEAARELQFVSPLLDWNDVSDLTIVTGLGTGASGYAPSASLRTPEHIGRFLVLGPAVINVTNANTWLTDSAIGFDQFTFGTGMHEVYFPAGSEIVAESGKIWLSIYPYVRLDPSQVEIVAIGTGIGRDVVAGEVVTTDSGASRFVMKPCSLGDTEIMLSANQGTNIVSGDDLKISDITIGSASADEVLQNGKDRRLYLCNVLRSNPKFAGSRWRVIDKNGVMTNIYAGSDVDNVATGPVQAEGINTSGGVSQSCFAPTVSLTDEILMPTALAQAEFSSGCLFRAA